MNALYLKYDWTEDQLHNHSVEFKIDGEGYSVAGKGKLMVSERIENRLRTGLLAVQVVATTPHADLSERKQLRFRPTQKLRFLIERHPNPDVADFRLSSYTIPTETKGVPQ